MSSGERLTQEEFQEQLQVSVIRAINGESASKEEVENAFADCY